MRATIVVVVAGDQRGQRLGDEDLADDRPGVAAHRLDGLDEPVVHFADGRLDEAREERDARRWRAARSAASRPMDVPVTQRVKRISATMQDDERHRAGDVHDLRR